MMNNWVVRSTLSIFQRNGDRWKGLSNPLEKMLSNLESIFGKQEADSLGTDLILAKMDGSFADLVIALVELINELLKKLNDKISNNEKTHADSSEEVKQKPRRKVKVQCTKSGYSTLNDIQDDMMKIVIPYVCYDRFALWKYGVVCKKMLTSVTDFMTTNKVLVDFPSDEKSYKNDLGLLKSSPLIARVVEKHGLVIAHNNMISKDDISIITKVCSNIRLLHLYNSNVTIPLLRAITLKCKKITHIHLGKCKHINEEMIQIVSDNCKYLEVIQLPYCTTINLNYSRKFDRRGLRKLFGADIEDFKIFHTPTQCNSNFSTPYRCGGLFDCKLYNETNSLFTLSTWLFNIK